MDNSLSYLWCVLCLCIYIYTHIQVYGQGCMKFVCVSKFNMSEIYLDSSSTLFVELESLSQTQSSLMKWLVLPICLLGWDEGR